MLQQRVFMMRATKDVGLILCIATLLCVFQSAIVSFSSPSKLLPLESREADFVLRGFHSAEQDQRSTFRWSTGDAGFDAYPLTSNSPLAFTFALGPPPAELVGMPLEVLVQEQVIAELLITAHPRRYHVLLPQNPPLSPSLPVQLQSASTTVPPDTRYVGVRIEAIGLERVGSSIQLPPLSTVVLQTGILFLFATTLRLLMSRMWVAASTLGVAVLLAIAFVTLPWLYMPYCVRIMIVLAITAATTLVGLAPFTQLTAWNGETSVARAVWGMALLACGVRLVGAVYPLFYAYDLSLNVGRFLRVSEGVLVAFNESFEFGGNLTVYPAGPYLLLLPGTFLGIAPGLVVQVGISLIDGWSVLLVALLARQLGASAGVCIIAALLMAIMPISLTSLYYGHTAQIFGQMLMMPLALLLLHALTSIRAIYWFGAAAVLSVALLTHIGVTVLAVAWLGLFWLVIMVGRTPAATKARYTVMFGGSIMLALALVYAPFVGLHLEQLVRIHAPTVEPTSGPAYNLIAKAYWISYTPIGIVLLGPGCALMMRFLVYPAKQLLLCWLGAAGMFAAVELATGLQVRYLVFLAPVAAIAAATVLDRVRTYSRIGWTVVAGVIVFWAAQSAAAWYYGVFANVAPSMIPLLR